MDFVNERRQPVWLELLGPSETDEPFSSAALHIALGADYSSLVFYEAGGKGDRYDSAGNIVLPENEVFDDFGEAISIMPGSAIDTASAQHAASEFLETGARPTSVAWRRFDLPSEGWLER
ncbi:Imm1 family immunity protein [Kribbella sp. NBC_01505]|uniref:Imm1 family immunity protein n=1 Tax=Kribbella sp. NBC_01505 TaxID=2903580 RepID=UPI003869C06A